MDASEQENETGFHRYVSRNELSLNIFIPYDPPNWNKYISMERANKYAASKTKKHEKQLIKALFNGVRYDGGYPAELEIRPHFKDQRKDLDNTRYKGILDGLVACGVIENDNLKHIQRIIIEPIFDDIDGLGITIRKLK